MKLDKYYPVGQPNQNLYNRVYASIPTYIYEDNRIAFWTGITMASASTVVPSYTITLMLSKNGLDMMASMFALYLGG